MSDDETDAATVHVDRRRVLHGIGAAGVGATIGAGNAGAAGTADSNRTPEDATTIEDWYDLDAVRQNLDDEYVLVNDLDEQTDGYDEVVGNQTSDSFTETRVGEFDQGDEVTLDRTPLATVSAADSSGQSIAVEIVDADAGSVAFQESLEESAAVEFDITTAAEKFVGFDPIGGDGPDGFTRFTGTFDGQGYEIRDLAIDRHTEIIVGLFAKTRGGSISNVALADAAVTGERIVGGLVAWNGHGVDATASVQNSSASGELIGQGAVGGLVGQNRGEVTGASANVHIAGDNLDGRFVGGLVGENSGRIVDSSASGSIAVDTLFVGGLAGINTGTIERSSASGAVETTERGAGGLIGQNRAGMVVESSASGAVAGGDRQVGGLAGENTDSIGGDETGVIRDCSAGGDVTGTTRVGGLLGENSSEVKRSWASGPVTGSDSSSGGIVGWNTGSITAGYWDTDASGTDTGIGNDNGDGAVTGLQTQQMQGAAAEQNMAELDFEATWLPDRTGPGYPTLQHRALTAYTDDRGAVEIAGVRNAVEDWSTGRIATDELRTLLNAWANGDRID